jgi:4-amino-4-deoxy-L-arabinose transferase-like glycosyltransferase
MTIASEPAIATPQVAHAPPVFRRAAVVFLVALVIRLAWTTFATVTPVSDFHGYDRLARTLLHTGELSHSMGRAYRTPAYPGLLAGTYAVFGEEIRAAWLVQAVLGALAAALVVVIASLMVSPGAALLAGLIQAVWPPAIIYTPVLSTENLAIPVLLLMIAAIGWAGRRGGRSGLALYALAGATYGLLLLVRPANLFFAPAVGLIVLWDFERHTWRLKAPLVFCVTVDHPQLPTRPRLPAPLHAGRDRHVVRQQPDGEQWRLHAAPLSRRTRHERG